MWSDGAVHTRWMALPEGSQLRIAADGDIEFPPGSVLMQHLAVDATLVETRLLMHHNDGLWTGYSYEWLDDQSDAILLPGSKTKVLPNGQTWTYPKRSDCTQCHTQAAGFALGVEVAQLNGTYLYPSTGREANQLRTLEHIGLFEAPLPAAPADLPALSMIADQAQPLEQRVRSYFQVNCAGCHRPEGPTPAVIVRRGRRRLTSICALARPCRIWVSAIVRPNTAISVLKMPCSFSPARRICPSC